MTYIENRQKKIPLNLTKIEQWLRQIQELLECEDDDISVILVDDKEIKSINRQYLGKDRPTNVISFPMREDGFDNVAPHLLGDIMVSVDTAERQSEESDIPLEDMILFLMIHGTLHLLGYDHETSEEGRKQMVDKEDELFFTLTGYYLERE